MPDKVHGMSTVLAGYTGIIDSQRTVRSPYRNRDRELPDRTRCEYGKHWKATVVAMVAIDFRTTSLTAHFEWKGEE